MIPVGVIGFARSAWALIGFRGALAIGFGLVAILALISRDNARDRAEDIQQAYFQQQAEYKTAQAEAAVKAKQAREAQEQHYRDLQEQSDVRLAEAESEAQSRANDFIRRNRLRQAACGASGGTGTGSGSGGAQSDNRSYSDTELVAVPTTDVKICTTLHTRLTAAQEWARSLTENN